MCARSVRRVGQLVPLEGLFAAGHVEDSPREPRMPGMLLVFRHQTAPIVRWVAPAPTEFLPGPSL
jgi:hypothetical protein